MEAKDLMIGDWVYNHRNWECPIVEIHKDSAIVIARHYGEEEFLLSDLRPIPLTPEILEKNWFKKLSGGSFLLEDLEGYYWVKFYPKDSNYTLGAYDYIDINWGCISIREIPIEFVHQLQHALRLCKIAKEIKL